MEISYCSKMFRFKGCGDDFRVTERILDEVRECGHIETARCGDVLYSPDRKRVYNWDKNEWIELKG